MSIILRLESSEFTGGALNFTDEEVDTVDLRPVRKLESRETQAGDLKRYRRGSDHWEIDIRFLIARYDTLIKIYEVHQADESFIVKPHYPGDTITSYTMVWINPDNFIERWRRGYPRANYALDATFREPLGAVCLPPS